MNKTELIEQLVPEIVKTQGKPPQVARRLLDNLTVSELTLMRDKQISSGIVITGGLTGAEITQAEHAANKLLESRRQLDQILQDRQEQALQVQAERHAREALTKQAQDREQEQKDRQTFEAGARRFGYSVAEANFKIIRDALGPGFSLIDIEGKLSSLIPATEVEQRQFRAEYIDQHNEYLKSLDMESLRRLVREQGIKAGNTTEFKTHHARQLKEAAEPARPPLPRQNQFGQAIDAGYLRRISIHNIELFRALVKKHGATAVTNRLNGLDGE